MKFEKNLKLFSPNIAELFLKFYGYFGVFYLWKCGIILKNLKKIKRKFYKSFKEYLEKVTGYVTVILDEFDEIKIFWNVWWENIWKIWCED